MRWTYTLIALAGFEVTTFPSKVQTCNPSILPPDLAIKAKQSCPPQSGSEGRSDVHLEPLTYSPRSPLRRLRCQAPAFVPTVTPWAPGSPGPPLPASRLGAPGAPASALPGTHEGPGRLTPDDTSIPQSPRRESPEQPAAGLLCLPPPSPPRPRRLPFEKMERTQRRGWGWGAPSTSCNVVPAGSASSRRLSSQLHPRRRYSTLTDLSPRTKWGRGAAAAGSMGAAIL